MVFAIPIRVRSRGPAKKRSSKRRPWLQRKTVEDFIDGCLRHLSIRNPRNEVFYTCAEFFYLVRTKMGALTQRSVMRSCCSASADAEADVADSFAAEALF